VLTFSVSFSAANLPENTETQMRSVELQNDPELTNSDFSSLDTELDNYLRERRIPLSANVYAYWHASQFPRLEPAARKHLLVNEPSKGSKV